MIVVDTQQIVYLTLKIAPFSAAATAIFETDAAWAAPRLWESEFRSAALQYVRAGSLSVDHARRAFQDAVDVVGDRSYEVSTADVLGLSAGNRLSAYDLEFVSLARWLGVPVVSGDKAMLRAFPETAVHPETFLARH